MEILIGCSALFILIWLIVKPFILLIIEAENDKYERDKKLNKE
tara:strand:+ start:1787 stop:1915 length:129 start_codon:yes stop_codon:yes gene_type:complete